MTIRAVRSVSNKPVVSPTQSGMFLVIVKVGISNYRMELFLPSGRVASYNETFNNAKELLGSYLQNFDKCCERAPGYNMFVVVYIKFGETGPTYNEATQILTHYVRTNVSDPTQQAQLLRGDANVLVTRNTLAEKQVREEDTKDDVTIMINAICMNDQLKDAHAKN